MSRTLRDLFKEFPFSYQGLLNNLPISGVTADSRQVKPGDVFVAIKGYTLDSHDFIPEVIKKGVSAVIGTQDIKNLPIPYIQVENSREALSYLAAAYFSFPARQLIMIGVTGTDGKTTTCSLIYHILKKLGYAVGMITTVNAVIGDRYIDTGFHVTTPDPIDVQRYLRMMVDEGLKFCILETTSHGWAQHRVDACEFDIGVITNITHEHLDEHGNYENYRNAKARLFESLVHAKKNEQDALRLAVINRDDDSYHFLRNKIEKFENIRTYSYSLDGYGDMNASNIYIKPEGQEFSVQFDQVTKNLTSKLMGKFNIANCLAALIATIVGVRIDPLMAFDALVDFSGVPGRMENIFMGQDFIALVDFAHTPNALKNIIETARSMASGKVIIVFGSAGLRDREKRRLMAEIGAKLADMSILTAEDPRTEALDEILREMEDVAVSFGAKVGETLEVVPDRGDAIRTAVRKAVKGDIVIVCGKGHEQSMCFGKQEYPWDDRTALKSALAELLKKPGPTMPVLPTSKNRSALY